MEITGTVLDFNHHHHYQYHPKRANIDVNFLTMLYQQYHHFKWLIDFGREWQAPFTYHQIKLHQADYLKIQQNFPSLTLSQFIYFAVIYEQHPLNMQKITFNDNDPLVQIYLPLPWFQHYGKLWYRLVQQSIPIALQKWQNIQLLPAYKMNINLLNYFLHLMPKNINHQKILALIQRYATTCRSQASMLRIHLSPTLNTRLNQEADKWHISPSHLVQALIMKAMLFDKTSHIVSTSTTDPLIQINLNRQLLKDIRAKLPNFHWQDLLSQLIRANIA